MELRTALLIVGIGVLGVVVAGSYRVVITDFINRLLAKFSGKFQLPLFERRPRKKRVRKKSPQLIPVEDFQQGFDFDESVDLIHGGDDAFYDDSEPILSDHGFPSLRPQDLDADTLEIEFGAVISGENPVTRDEALGIFRQHEYELEKPLRILARSVETGEWRAPRTARACREGRGYSSSMRRTGFPETPSRGWRDRPASSRYGAD